MAVQDWLLPVCTLGYFAGSCSTQNLDIAAVTINSTGWDFDGCYKSENVTIICYKEDAYLLSPIIYDEKCLEARIHTFGTPYIDLYMIPVGMERRSLQGQGIRRSISATEKLFKLDIEADRPYRIQFYIKNYRDDYDTEIRSFQVWNSTWNCHFSPTSCESNMFYCSPGECINNDYRCDGRSDCVNGRDEYSCSDLSGFHYSYLAALIPVVVMIVLFGWCGRQTYSRRGAESVMNLRGVTQLDDQQGAGGDNQGYAHSDNLPPSYGECTADNTQLQNGEAMTQQPDNQQGVIVEEAGRNGGPVGGQDRGDDPMPPDYDQVVSGGFIELDPSLNPELPQRHPLQVYRLQSTHL